MTENAEEVRVVHRDHHYLVLHKPSGLVTTTPGDGPSLVQVARRLDPEAPRMHPSSRLDASVSGLVVFARTRAATKHLMSMRSRSAYSRLYLALACAAPVPAAGSWRDAIAIDPADPRRRTVAPEAQAGRREAWTEYETAAVLPAAALLLLRPQTGRTHQLRVHAAAANCALLGDRHYDGPSRVVMPDGRALRAARVMLHCARVSFPHPALGRELILRAEPEPDMQQLWQDLGGRAQDLKSAVEWPSVCGVAR